MKRQIHWQRTISAARVAGRAVAQTSPIGLDLAVIV